MGLHMFPYLSLSLFLSKCVCVLWQQVKSASTEVRDVVKEFNTNEASLQLRLIVVRPQHTLTTQTLHTHTTHTLHTHTTHTYTPCSTHHIPSRSARVRVDNNISG